MASETEITNYLNSVLYSWYYSNYRELGRLVKKFYKNDSANKLSDTTVSSIIKVILNKATYYGDSYNKYYDDLFESLKLMFSHYTPADAQLISILEKGVGALSTQNNSSASLFKNNKDIYDAFKVLHDRKVSLVNEKLFKTALVSNKYVIDLISQYQKPSEDLLNIATKNGCAGLTASLIYQKIPLKVHHLQNAVDADSGETLKILIDMGGKCTQKLFDSCCQSSKDPEIFSQILRDKSIVISRSNFNDIVRRCTREESSRNRYRYYTNRSVTKIPAKIVANIIDVFINHNYKITKDDVICALDNNAYINNIETHIKLDTSIWEACSRNNYYPYNLSSITPSLSILRTECKRQSAVKSIEQVIKAGTLPDNKCLENACTFKTNTPVVRMLLTKHKMKPTKQSLVNIANSIGNSTLSLLVNALPDKILYPETNESNTSEATKKATSKKKPTTKKSQNSKNDNNNEKNKESNDDCSNYDENDFSDDDSDDDIEDISKLDTTNMSSINSDYSESDEESDESDNESDGSGNESVTYEEYNEEIDDKLSDEDSDLQNAIKASMEDLKKQQENILDDVQKQSLTKPVSVESSKKTIGNSKTKTTKKITETQKPKDSISSKSSKKENDDKTTKKNKNIYITKKGHKVLIDNDSDDNTLLTQNSKSSVLDDMHSNDKGNDNNNDNITSKIVQGDDILTDIIHVTKFIQKRQKSKPTVKMIQFWTLDKKEELSFLEVRKKLVSYITTNKLYDTKDKNLIKVDSRMKDVLDLELNKFFKFNDMDHVVMQFYK